MELCCNIALQGTKDGCLPVGIKALQRSYAAEPEKALQYDIIQISIGHLHSTGPLRLCSSKTAQISSI